MTAGPFEVILERRARKNLATLDPHVRRRAASCIDELTADPRPPGATELKGSWPPRPRPASARTAPAAAARTEPTG